MIRRTTARALPDGWQAMRLGDVAEVVRGLSWFREQESSAPVAGAVPVVRIGNVQPDGFHMDDVLYVRGVAESERLRRAISPRTLVMVGSNGNRDRVGNVSLSDRRVEGHLIASFLIAVEPSEDVSERFLAVWRSGVRAPSGPPTLIRAFRRPRSFDPLRWGHFGAILRLLWGPSGANQPIK